MKFFIKNGFRRDRQKGSHVVLEKDGVSRSVVIPHPCREVKIGVVKSSLADAGISEDYFKQAMQNPKQHKIKK